jgi:hypothetical protein
MKTMAPTKIVKKSKPKLKTSAKSCRKASKGKHPGGRPPKYKTAKELQEKIDAYFDSCWIDKVTEVTDKEGICTMSTVRYQNRPYTVAGLALALDLCRDTLAEYVKAGQFSDIIKKAKLKIEMNVEELLLEGKNAAGPIFWLKNHAAYRDKQEMEHTGPEGGPIQMIIKKFYMDRETGTVKERKNGR